VTLEEFMGIFTELYTTIIGELKGIRLTGRINTNYTTNTRNSKVYKNITRRITRNITQIQEGLQGIQGRDARRRREEGIQEGSYSFHSRPTLTSIWGALFWLATRTSPGLTQNGPKPPKIRKVSLKSKGDPPEIAQKWPKSRSQIPVL